MSRALNQPNFFEGQMMGAQDLNRLAQFATERAKLPLGYLAGGILRNVGNEFQVTADTTQGLELIVHSGAALSGNGNFYYLPKPTKLNLYSIRPLTLKSS